MGDSTKQPDKTCRLALLTWTWADSEGQKEVVPMCPKHPAGKIRIGTFGTGMIVVCQEDGSHFVKLFDREPFEAERKEARSRLDSAASDQEQTAG